MTREKQNEDKNLRNSEVTQERILNQKTNTIACVAGAWK